MTRVAIVTGAAAGLGRLLTEGLAAAGYTVVGADVAPPGDPAGAAAGSIVRADVREPGDAARIVAAARAVGGPHVLVNNAGGWTPGAQFPEAGAAEWAATIELNLVAPMRLTQLVLEPMRALGGGAVVNISSSGGVGAEAYGSPEYGAAKAGLIRFTTAAAGLGGSHGVRVMGVVPGWIGLPRAHEQRARMSAAERTAAGPLIPPSDVVATVLDLIASGTAGEVREML